MGRGLSDLLASMLIRKALKREEFVLLCLARK